MSGTALHYAARHRDPAVLKLLIQENPRVLLATDHFGCNPRDYVHDFFYQCLVECPSAIVSLLNDATDCLAARDFAALAELVDGDEQELRYRAKEPPSWMEKSWR